MAAGYPVCSVLIYRTRLQPSPFPKTHTYTDAIRARESEPSVELSMYGEGDWDGDEAAAMVTPMAARYDDASRLDLSEWLRVILRSI